MSLKGEKAVVCGAGGFIGGHLVKALTDNGVEVIRAVDIKPLDQWYQTTSGVENLSLDLKNLDNCMRTTDGTTTVFQLAADMGGMGFIESNKALCMLSVLTNTHMLMAARANNVGRFFFSSSACVYNGDMQTNPDVVALKEENAYPAAHVPALPRGLWAGYARCALPQCFWSGRYLDRRARKGPGRGVPQGDRSEEERRS